MAADVPTVDPTMRHRIADATVTVLGPHGEPLPNTEVTVEQSRHAFSFGNIGFDFIPLANGENAEHPTVDGLETFGGADVEQLVRLSELWLDLFNTATVPFYWGRFEPRRGEPDTERLRRTGQWFADRGVTVKGHPLVWHTVTAPWLLDLPVDEVEKAQRERIRRDVGGVSLLTKGMCADLGPHGIQVNALSPGYFSTELTQALVDDPEFSAWVEKRTPAGRWGNTEELVGTLIFLLSSASDFVNDETIYVDGGMTAVV